jgi:uncharacterized protein
MNKTLAIILIVLGIFIIWFYTKNPLTTIITIRGHRFQVDVAATDAEKEKGLGLRDNLDLDKGMIFPYDHTAKYSFWMKRMRFPLDIIWIRDNVIVDISKDVPVATGSSLPTYSPRTEVNKVLELNAGVSDQYGFQVGDIVVIRN